MYFFKGLFSLIIAISKFFRGPIFPNLVKIRENCENYNPCEN